MRQRGHVKIVPEGARDEFRARSGEGARMRTIRAEEMKGINMRGAVGLMWKGPCGDGILFAH